MTDCLASRMEIKQSNVRKYKTIAKAEVHIPACVKCLSNFEEAGAHSPHHRKIQSRQAIFWRSHNAIQMIVKIALTNIQHKELRKGDLDYSLGNNNNMERLAFLTPF